VTFRFTERQPALAGFLRRTFDVHISAPDGADPTAFHPEIEDDLLCMLAAHAHALLAHRKVAALRPRLELVKDGTLLRWQDQRLAEAS
jgi:hypothetical protein